MAKVLGYWKSDKNDNFDEYMKAAGVGVVLRKVGTNTTSYENIQQNGDDWTLAITSTFKNKTLNFKLGEEFDEETMDGRKVKSTFTVDGDKLIHNQKGIKPGDIDSIITRERVDDDTMKAEFLAVPKNVKAVRIFKKVEK